MKYRISFILLFSILLSPLLTFSQSKKELEEELKATKSKLDSFQVLYYQQQAQYQQRITSLEATIADVRGRIERLKSKGE